MFSSLLASFNAPSVNWSSSITQLDTPNPLSTSNEGKFDQPAPVSCLRDVIAKNHTFYQFACLTGIIKPVAGENANGWTNMNIRYRLWVNYLHVSFVAQCAVMIALACLIGVNSDTSHQFIAICEVLGLLVQNLLLFPAIVYLRRELTASRDIDLDQYNQAFHHAMLQGRWVFLALGTMMVLFVVFIGVGSGDAALGTALSVLLFVTCLPSNCFLTGVFTFLVMEQRLSFFAMQRAQQGVLDRDLTEERYKAIRDSIDYRDQLNPVNWLVSAAIMNTLFAIVVIIGAHSDGDQESSVDVFINIIFVLSAFGRQLLVLLCYLHEMAQVNAIAETMLFALAKQSWGELNEVRLNLYLLMKEMPLGSSLFFYRPSRFALFAQILSAVGGVAIAIFWAFLFA